MVKGNVRAEVNDYSRYVGLEKFSVVAVCPSREELNTLLGSEGKSEEIEYCGEDNEGNAKVRLSFWLKGEKTGKFFAHNISLINKEKMDKEKVKFQYINSVLDTSWAEDPEKDFPDWFRSFIKDDEEIGEKTYKKALVGEEELGIFLKAWFGKIDFYDPAAEITVDRKKLFAGNFKDLRENLSQSYVTPFVGLLGVKTDDEDPSKQYQQIYSKAFLPAYFMISINNGMNFSQKARKTWDRFVKSVEDPANAGKYGFKAYYVLEPVCEYDKSKDVSAGGVSSKPPVTASNDNY